MKVVRIHEHGGAEVLCYEDVEMPRLKPHEVLVRIKATSINHLDIWIRKGIPGTSLPLILGSDGAGVIEEIGEFVSGWNIGDEVILQPAVSCGKCIYCQSGRHNFCDHYKILGEQINGCDAEYVTVLPEDLLPKPKQLTYEEAAAIPLVFLTAWEMLVTKAKIKPGDTVLIWSAGSGVGSAAMQIGRLFQVQIIATAGNKEKLEKAREFGANHVINHYEQNVSKEVKRITNRRGVDVVIEHVGKATWQHSIKCLAKGGKIVTCGATTGFDAEIDLRFLFFRQQQILGSTMGAKSDLHKILKFVDQGKLQPVVDSVFHFQNVVDAHNHVEERHHFGKVVLVP